MPLYDAISKLVGIDGADKEYINRCVEVAPLAYLRGRTFDNSVCILDEAQNCTKMQLKLFLTRLGQDSKMIITADPKQSDLKGDVAIVDLMSRLESIRGIGKVEFNESGIVRHPLVIEILKKLD